jgi:hypothetical protein
MRKACRDVGIFRDERAAIGDMHDSCRHWVMHLRSGLAIMHFILCPLHRPAHRCAMNTRMIGYTFAGLPSNTFSFISCDLLDCKT